MRVRFVVGASHCAPLQGGASGGSVPLRAPAGRGFLWGRPTARPCGAWLLVGSSHFAPLQGGALSHARPAARRSPFPCGWVRPTSRPAGPGIFADPACGASLAASAGHPGKRALWRARRGVAATSGSGRPDRRDLPPRTWKRSAATDPCAASLRLTAQRRARPRALIAVPWGLFSGPPSGVGCAATSGSSGGSGSPAARQPGSAGSAGSAGAQGRERPVRPRRRRRCRSAWACASEPRPFSATPVRPTPSTPPNPTDPPKGPAGAPPLRRRQAHWPRRGARVRTVKGPCARSPGDQAKSEPGAADEPRRATGPVLGVARPERRAARRRPGLRILPPPGGCAAGRACTPTHPPRNANRPQPQKAKKAITEVTAPQANRPETRRSELKRAPHGSDARDPRQRSRTASTAHGRAGHPGSTSGASPWGSRGGRRRAPGGGTQ